MVCNPCTLRDSLVTGNRLRRAQRKMAGQHAIRGAYRTDHSRQSVGLQQLSYRAPCAVSSTGSSGFKSGGQNLSIFIGESGGSLGIAFPLAREVTTDPHRSRPYGTQAAALIRAGQGHPVWPVRASHAGSVPCRALPARRGATPTTRPIGSVDGCGFSQSRPWHHASARHLDARLGRVAGRSSVVRSRAAGHEGLIKFRTLWD